MKKTIPVIGMACSACSAHVERKLNSLKGVNEANVSLATRTALVDYDPKEISLEDMKREISKAGYDLVIETGRSADEINRREFSILRRKTVISWIFSILVMSISMGWIDLTSSNIAFTNQICLIIAFIKLIFIFYAYYALDFSKEMF